MILFQIFVSFFALLMMYFVTDQYRRGTLSPFEHRVWMILWLVFIGLSFFPGLLQGLVHTFNVSSVFDFLNIIALMIIVFVLLRQRVTILKVRQQLEQLVRENALTQKKQG